MPDTPLFATAPYALLGLARNLAVVVLGVLFYCSLKDLVRRWPRGVHQLMESLLFALLILVTMAEPLLIGSGYRLDSRGALIGTAVLFAGPIVGLATALVAGFYCFWIGGVAAPSGVLSIALSYLAALAVWARLSAQRQPPALRHLLLLGLLLALCALAGAAALPSTEPRLSILGPAFLPALFFVPLATLVLGAVILRAEEVRSLADALADSEARLRTVIQHFPQPIAIRDREGRYVLLNPAAERESGIPVQALLGKTRAFLQQHLQVETSLEGIDEEVLRTGKVVRFGPLSGVIKGEKHWAIGWNFPIFNASGAIEAIGGTMIDVTDLIAAREALERREATLNRHQKALLDIVRSSVFTGRRFQEALGAITKLAGEAMQVERTAIFRIEYSEGVQRCLALWERGAARHGSSPDLPLEEYGWLGEELGRERVLAIDNALSEPRLALRREQYRALDLRSLLVAAVYVEGQMRGHLDFDAIGESRRWSAEEIAFARSVADLVAHVLLEREREELQLQLQQAGKMEAIGQLAGGVAHDFNNLLASIQGFAGFLVQDLAPGSEQSRFAQRILRAGERGKGLVAQILAFARSQPIERRLVDLGAVLRESQELLAGSLPATTRLAFEYPGDPVAVDGSEAQLGQVVVNLCINAHDALGGKPGVVTVNLTRFSPGDDEARRFARRQAGRVIVGRLDPQRAYARIMVSDAGPGIPAELVGRIAEPFFTTKERGRGTGLGLAVVHGIVTSYDGAYSIESTPGAGTKVSVYLPLAPGRTPAASSGPPGPHALHGRERVLVVDDEEDLTDTLAIGLQRLGYEVVGVDDPLAALGAMEENPRAWDVVVTDQVMPGMPGLTLIGKLKALSPNLHIILCSGFADGASEQSAKQAGADAFFLKPVSPEQIAAQIRAMMAANTHTI
jgi:PAS domain S-box-containing protein